jgi:hypothetical protein
MSDWTSIKVARRAFLTVALFVIVGVAAGPVPCYNIAQGSCGTYTAIGSITCYRLVDDPNNPGQQIYQACVSYPYQIIWPTPLDRCTEATSHGRRSCHSDGGPEIYAQKCTYACIEGQCAVQWVECVDYLTCRHAQLGGDECDPM